MDYQEAYGYTDESSVKSHRSWWIIFFGVIVVAIFLGSYFFIASFMKSNVSENRLIEGASLNVEANNTVKLNVGDEEEHSLSVDFVGLDSVEITIRSEPIKLNLTLNEIQEVDLNGDGNPDLRVKLVSIKDGKAIVAVKKIGLEICEERWICEDWSSCSRGKQKRTCEDVSGCGTTFDRPERERNCLEVEFVKNDSAFENENRLGEEKGNLTRNETRDGVNESSVEDGVNNAEDFDAAGVPINSSGNFENGSTEFNASEENSVENESSFNAAGVAENSSEVLEFNYEKDRLEVGEPFKINYKLNYPEDSQVIVYAYKKDLGREIFHGFYENPDYSEQNYILRALTYNHFYFESDSFREPGIYVYEIALYSCSTVNSNLGIDDCFVSGIEDGINKLSEFEPLKKIYKEIVVSGNALEPECESNSDCTNSCVNCASGLERCIYNTICGECFFSRDCKEGYDCVGNVCVVD